MLLRTQALDCLTVNWAVPSSSAPPVPEPLRYELHEWRGEDWIFVSALFFRHSGLHHERLPQLRFSYPQLSFRFYVLDGDGVPSILLQRSLVPYWVVPMSRIGREPADGASFAFPEPSRDPQSCEWTWKVRCRKAIAVKARPGAPVGVAEGSGQGPPLGPWERTVDYFRHRSRGYAMRANRLRVITPSRPPVEVLPMRAEVEEAGLLTDILADRTGDLLGPAHSAWLCPEISFVVELGAPIRLPLPQHRLPATEVPRTAARCANLQREQLRSNQAL